MGVSSLPSLSMFCFYLQYFTPHTLRRSQSNFINVPVKYPASNVALSATLVSGSRMSLSGFRMSCASALSGRCMTGRCQLGGLLGSRLAMRESNTRTNWSMQPWQPALVTIRLVLARPVLTFSDRQDRHRDSFTPLQNMHLPHRAHLAT